MSNARGSSTTAPASAAIGATKERRCCNSRASLIRPSRARATAGLGTSNSPSSSISCRLLTLSVSPDGIGSQRQFRSVIPLPGACETGRRSARFPPNRAREVSAGSTVLLYTDGLIERRAIDRGIDASLDAAVPLAAASTSRLTRCSITAPPGQGRPGGRHCCPRHPLPAVRLVRATRSPSQAHPSCLPASPVPVIGPEVATGRWPPRGRRSAACLA
ncbi:hypothetical protein E9549_17535 [Blastococcus sp. MG754426]|nr:hypothetical protein [Blastococcus sp. MG754426]MCF6513719.1 hypothetical protein [Blastococcus sp. MG754427]